jgi:hypothetical protein
MSSNFAELVKFLQTVDSVRLHKAVIALDSAELTDSEAIEEAVQRIEPDYAFVGKFSGRTWLRAIYSVYHNRARLPQVFVLKLTYASFTQVAIFSDEESALKRYHDVRRSHQSDLVRMELDQMTATPDGGSMTEGAGLHMEWEHAARPKVETAAMVTVKALSSMVNNFNFDTKAFVDQFCREHRTLQASMFRLFMEVLEHCASDDYRTDGRNHSVKVTAETLLSCYREYVRVNFELTGASLDQMGKPSKWINFV